MYQYLPDIYIIKFFFSILSNLETNSKQIYQKLARYTGVCGYIVDPRHQTPQGPSVTNPETPLQNILIGNVTYWIWLNIELYI